MSNQDIEKSTMMLGGKGVESFITRLKLKRRHLSVSFAVGLVAAVAIFVVYLSAVSPMTASLAGNELAQTGADEAIEWSVKCRLNDWDTKGFKCGSASRPDEYVSTVVSLPGGKTKLTKAEYDSFISNKFIPAGYSIWKPNPLVIFKLMSAIAIFSFIGASFFAFRLFFKVGKEETTNKRIDGVLDLVSDKELTKLVKKSPMGDCGWSMVGVSLPQKSMVMGLSVIGAQGTGKSLALHDLIIQAKNKDVRLFINDPAGEFWRAHGNPENGDVFFNPALLGGVNWSIFKELVYEYDSDVLANAFLPKRESKGNGDFFDDAARALFSALLRRLAEMGAVNSNEIAKAFFQSSEDELAALVAGTAAADAVSGDAKGMRAGVMASAAVHMSGIAMMESGDWNFRDFLNQSKGNIYFVGDEAKFRAIKRLMFSTAFEVIKDLNVHRHDLKYLFILDEYPVLGDVDVDRHLAEKRKFGAGVVLGMQAETQLVTLMGEPRADTTLSVIGTTLQLRIPDAKAQKRAEAKFGMQNMRMVAESQTLAIAESKDSLGINKTQQDKALILGSKFGMLDIATGYMSVLGGFPSAKVDYRWWFKQGSSTDGKTTRVNEINSPIIEYPEKDPRFLLKIQTGGDWQQGVQIDVMKAQIYNLQQFIPTLTQDAAKQKRMDQLKALETKLAMLEGGEVPASDQKFGIEAEDLDMDIDMDTGEILMPDDDGLLI